MKGDQSLLTVVIVHILTRSVIDEDGTSVSWNATCSKDKMETVFPFPDVTKCLVLTLPDLIHVMKSCDQMQIQYCRIFTNHFSVRRASRREISC